DVCLNVAKDRGRDLCAVGIDRTLPADPRRLSLRWAPAGGRLGPDVVTFDRAGNALTEDQLKLTPARILLGRVFPLSRTVDLASGEGHVDLEHPETVSSVECATARCELTEGGVIVRAIPATVTTVAMKVRLLPRVFLARGETLDASPTETLSILRCPLAMVS